MIRKRLDKDAFASNENDKDAVPAKGTASKWVEQVYNFVELNRLYSIQDEKN